MMMKLIIYISYLFGISELMLLLFKRTKSASVRVRKDRGSLIILWITILAGLFSGFYLANYGKWSPVNYYLASAGIIIYVSGLLVRWISIVQLRQRFTVNVAVNKKHTLETSGMYKHLRHPSYLGILLIMAGLGLAMNSLASFLLVISPVFFGLSYRISVEEKLLENEFGQQYVQFRSTRKKMIPFIY